MLLSSELLILMACIVAQWGEKVREKYEQEVRPLPPLEKAALLKSLKAELLGAKENGMAPSVSSQTKSCRKDVQQCVRIIYICSCSVSPLLMHVLT